MSRSRKASNLAVPIRFGPSTKHKAFTLLELVIVVAIILVLAALLLPVGRAVLTASSSAKCVSNLRQIYVATLAFTEDYGGKLPPSLGPATVVDPEFSYNAYWWSQAYLGRYTVGPLNRRRDSGGKLTQSEAAIYNCPARLADEPDQLDGNGNPSVSYVMAVTYPKNATKADPSKYMLRTMDNKSKLAFITEGRGGRFYNRSKTYPLGDGRGGLRRFHNGAMNILFFDGHVESFSGTDEDLAAMTP